MESTPIAAGLEPVDPVSPVAAYVGGKRNLSGRLSALIASVPHRIYAEPFVGLGGVFLRRKWRPRIEVINDISADIAGLFRLLQRHPQSFMDELKWRLSSRAEFNRLMLVDPATLTDFERGARFLYLQRTAFGGKVVGRNFAMARHTSSRFDTTKLFAMLEAVHERLAGVTIEQLPYADFISRYDAADALFYLDPPYFGSEDYYGPTFSAADYVALRDALAAAKGRFILSINDAPQIREIFAPFQIDEAQHNFRVSGKPTEARELIISRL